MHSVLRLLKSSLTLSLASALNPFSTTLFSRYNRPLVRAFTTTNLIMSDFKDTSEFLDAKWQQSMLRIKDPKVTVPFYEKHFNMQLIHNYNFPQWSFSLYFMAILPEGMKAPPPNTKESEAWLWDCPKGVLTLELTHNHGTEKDDNFKVNTGNVEPHRGFGHIAFMCPDVYKAAETLEANGVNFRKRPDEGRMKGIAFATCPDGYWIELVKRNDASDIKLQYTLAQTMMRVKDPVKSLHFYRDLMGLNLIRESPHSDFTNYFLSHSPEGSDATMEYNPVLELTHNHGTENNQDFKYHDGNTNDAGQGQGFGHIGFIVNDLEKTCEYLEEKGCTFRKKPDTGMAGLAFVYDPDGYSVELIQKGVTFM